MEIHQLIMSFFSGIGVGCVVFNVLKYFWKKKERRQEQLDKFEEKILGKIDYKFEKINDEIKEIRKSLYRMEVEGYFYHTQEDLINKKKAE